MQQPPQEIMAASQGTDVPLAQQTPRERLVDMARTLQKEGHEVELQGTVIHRHFGASVALHGLLCGAACVAGSTFPFFMGGLLLAIAGSTVSELDGGRGWLRTWIPRHAGHNLIAWAKPNPARRVLAFVPLDTNGVQRPLLVTLGAVGVAAAIAGIGLLGLSLGLPTGAVAGPCAVVAIISAFAAAMSMARGQPKRVAQAQALATQLSKTTFDDLRLDVVVMEGCSDQLDGLALALRQNEHRFHPRDTHLLLILPSEGPTEVVQVDGWIRRAPLSQGSATRLMKLPVEPIQRATPLGPWRRQGWSAITVRGDVDPSMLREIVQALG